MQSVPLSVVPYVWKALLWTLRHPFVLRPTTWTLLLAAWLGVALALAAGSISLKLAVPAMGVLLAAIILPLFAWNRLLRASELFIVFLSRFATLGKEHETHAATHALKMRQRLDGCPALVSVAELRNIGSSVTRQDAARLLDASPARAVVFGHLLVAADEMQVDAELLRRRPAADPRQRTPAPASRRAALAPVHTTFSDPGIPLANLVRGRLDDAHAAWIEQELLASLASYGAQK